MAKVAEMKKDLNERELKFCTAKELQAVLNQVSAETGSGYLYSLTEVEKIIHFFDEIAPPILTLIQVRDSTS